MKKRILLGTVALAAMTTSALAADLPSRRAPPVYVPPIPVFSWTGFYIGGQAGYAFGKDSVARTGGPAAFPTGTTNPSGFIAGGHLGYNFSTQSLGVPFLGGVGAGGLVIGVEADIDGTDYTNIPRTIRNDIQGSARGRVGIAVDRALFYATGGAAIAQFHNAFGAVGGFLVRRLRPPVSASPSVAVSNTPSPRSGRCGRNIATAISTGSAIS